MLFYFYPLFSPYKTINYLQMLQIRGYTELAVVMSLFNREDLVCSTDLYLRNSLFLLLQLTKMLLKLYLKFHNIDGEFCNINFCKWLMNIL